MAAALPTIASVGTRTAVNSAHTTPGRPAEKPNVRADVTWERRVASGHRFLCTRASTRRMTVIVDGVDVAVASAGVLHER
jgi:hypothetical protein